MLTDTGAGADRAWYGVYPAIVASVQDPDACGRVAVRLPWVPESMGEGYQAWARVATLMAGQARGSWFVPDVGDEVLVAFEAGDPRRPYVVGALWNGRDAPPAAMDAAGRNDIKMIRSRRGVTITLDDGDGRERLRLETPGGRSVTLEDGAGGIVVADGDGNAIRLERSGVTVTAAATVTVAASRVSVQAGVVDIASGLVRCSGVLQADTVITNSVVSASYTPGAGNIW